MGDPLQRIVAGLTYNGTVLDILINYSLVAITLMPFLAPGAHGSARLGNRWAGCFLIALALQVLLWLTADAVGVSVIWATMAGYSLVLRATCRDTFSPDRRLLTVALVSALIGIVYYAVTLPPITTVAHIIALLLGIGICSIPRAALSHRG